MVHDEETKRGETLKTTLPVSSEGTVVKAIDQNRRNTPSDRDSCEIRAKTVKNGQLWIKRGARERESENEQSREDDRELW